MNSRWSAEKANIWYAARPWLVGSNFTPSTAINQLEMWQAETFDPQTIQRELGWAAELGFNIMRVYLHDLVWQADEVGYKQRIDTFLDICAGLRIAPLFVLFDDCWDNFPKLGKQREPIPGMHNSGWVQGPGAALVRDPSGWARLESYVKGVLSTFTADERLLGWDLYNEPGNSGLGNDSIPLLQAAFEWARAVNPTQPLTVGVWFDNPKLNEIQLSASDIISFHNYGNLSSLEGDITRFKALGRPIICTEYMARGNDCRFQTHLPVFKRERIAAINWGLVEGKSQTKYPWGSPEGASEPRPWFHDIFRMDGSPYDSAECDFIRLTVKYR